MKYSNTIAHALSYDGENAPIIAAKGEADVAQQIIDIAQAHGVPVYENAELTRLLNHSEVGDEIPESLFICVAEIIAFAYYLREQRTQWEKAQATNAD